MRNKMVFLSTVSLVSIILTINTSAKADIYCSSYLAGDNAQICWKTESRINLADENYNTEHLQAESGIYGTDGNNNLVAGIVDEIRAGAGNDTISIRDGDDVDMAVWGDEGDDLILMSGGRVGAFIAGRDGRDRIVVSGGVVGDAPYGPGQGVYGGRDDDTIELLGGRIFGGVYGDATEVGQPTSFSANDFITLDGATIEGVLEGGLGSDRIDVLSGTVNGYLHGDEQNATQGGNDTINMSGGLIRGNVFGGGGTDELRLSGGSIDGSVEGFERIQVNGSQTIRGTLSAVNSVISLQDNAADDTLTLGGLTMRNSTIEIDVDQATQRADSIFASQADTSGPNTLNVRLLNTPNFTGETTIPIVLGGQLDASDFNIAGIPDDPASMFSFRLAPGGNGAGLVLIATPANIAPATTTQAAIDSRPAETASQALTDVTNQAADNALGLGSSTRSQITPTFGVFSSGQFGRVDHDGFTVSGAAVTGLGPSFTSDDFSAAVSLDFDAGKHFGIGEAYGLNLGLFGGYASSEVTLDRFEAFTTSIGNASNDSILLGGYGLFRSGFNYALVSGTAFIGDTDIVNNAVGSTGTYDTTGYAFTASVGHIFQLTDMVKFDLRGGVLAARFKGDAYTDSKGVGYGSSKVSFGAVKFEPGIYADYQLESGKVLSPYLRLDLQQRFNYENTTAIGGTEFDFDDADFSAAASAGFNLRITQQATLSAEVRGKFSGDSSTISGKLGLKIGF